MFHVYIFFNIFLYKILVYSIPATCPANGTSLDFTVLKLPGELNKSWRPSLCNSHIRNFSVYCSFFDSEIFLSTVFSNSCNFCSSLKKGDVSHHSKRKINADLISLARLMSLKEEIMDVSTRNLYFTHKLFKFLHYIVCQNKIKYYFRIIKFIL